MCKSLKPCKDKVAQWSRNLWNRIIKPKQKKADDESPTKVKDPNADDRRYAIEEANRYIRHLESQYWPIASLLLIGTGFCISNAIDFKGDPNTTLYSGIIITIVWILFLFFQRNHTRKSTFFIDIVNNYEDAMQIDVLRESTDLRKEQSPWKQNPFKNGYSIPSLMTVMAIGQPLLWGFLFAKHAYGTDFAQCIDVIVNVVFKLNLDSIFVQ